MSFLSCSFLLFVRSGIVRFVSILAVIMILVIMSLDVSTIRLVLFLAMSMILVSMRLAVYTILVWFYCQCC